ncbi:hypothetical protein U4E84_00780 [Halorubrum sp. AD140]|uniref:hypothetical protein n=1 Tax=Halorubrum sp. AD140 TaxID=3050073 RepID=UPI002ACCC3EC|nr:hypothetical protein [Halorubrum sp. AD140]MDZ5809887.1 hypothetical protein [Halorubrum sp. AD140]
MVDERLTDGVRIGQLLASELTGDGGRLRDLALSDADPDVEPTPDGALAYRIVRAGDGDPDDTDVATVSATDAETAGAALVAEVYVQPNRVRIEFVGRGIDDGDGLPEAAADAAGEAGLRVRPKAVRPPRTLVFVEDGAQVKRALPVFAAVVDAR